MYIHGKRQAPIQSTINYSHCIEYAVVHSPLLVSKPRVGRVIACTAKIYLYRKDMHAPVGISLKESLCCFEGILLVTQSEFDYRNHTTLMHSIPMAMTAAAPRPHNYGRKGTTRREDGTGENPKPNEPYPIRKPERAKVFVDGHNRLARKKEKL